MGGRRRRQQRKRPEVTVSLQAQVVVVHDPGHGRRDLYRHVSPDAASIAVSRLLAQFGEAAIGPFVEQVCREPRLRSVLRGAVSRSW